MSAGRICSRVVVTGLPTETVRVAARRMAENDVGTMVVIDPARDNEPIGVVTDRDIATRCVAVDLDPGSTPVERVMTTPVHSVDQDTSIEDAVSRMADGGTRRLVVTGERRKLVGILSVDDVLELLSEEADSIARLLEKQRPKIPA